MIPADLDPRAKGARRLDNKVCIVTGAGQGIGRATARRFGAEGARVVVVDRVEQTAKETLQQLTDHGVEAIVVTADLGLMSGAKEMVDRALERWGCVDAMVNVVGGTIWWQQYHEYREDQVHRELERSLFPTLWCCSAVLPAMVQQGGGSIVNLSSAVVRGGLYRTPYAAAKGGIEAITRTLAGEYGRHGIRVNAVSPGSTAVPDRVTSRLDLGAGQRAEMAEGTEACFEEARGDLRKLALARQSSADEQAAAIAFLASDDSSYITGQIINCFGDP